MKTATPRLVRLSILFLLFSLNSLGQSTGRVVINEYMPWTSNGCATTSEFVELLNFGPGPVNVSGYILTTGVYSITIPNNTIIKAGGFYVVSGRDIIPNDCANIDSNASGVHADLNWNTCQCTNQPIPAVGDGLLKDGGSSNTPLVLFDSTLKVIDAVVRSLPGEPSVPLTTSSVNGTFQSKTFNLNLLPIDYEELGMSAGRANSFARRVDGDCEWVKDPQQSGNATNNRSGETAGITYNFNMVRATDCSGVGGKVSITANYSNYAAIFPMTYTLALDTNHNGLFDTADKYIAGVDSTAPSIDINNLASGQYRIAVSSGKGCFLKTFDFMILNCAGVLPTKLEYFRLGTSFNSDKLLEWKLSGVENVKSIIVQKAPANGVFVDENKIDAGAYNSPHGLFQVSVATAGSFSLYRLKIILKNGTEFLSNVLNTVVENGDNKFWPNPVVDQMHIQFSTPLAAAARYAIYNIDGKSMQEGKLPSANTSLAINIALAGLPAGIYQMRVNSGSTKPISFSFVKQ